MGLFSKIFGASEDGEPPAAGAPQPRTDELPTALDPALPSKGPPGGAQKAATAPLAETIHGSGPKSKSRPSVPPSVEARLFAPPRDAPTTLRHPPPATTPGQRAPAAPSSNARGASAASRAAPAPKGNVGGAAATHQKKPDAAPVARSSSSALSPSRTHVIGGSSGDKKSQSAASKSAAPAASAATPPAAPAAAGAKAGPGALELEPLALASVIPPAEPAAAVPSGPSGPSDPTIAVDGAHPDDIDHAFEHLAAGAAPPGTTAMAGMLADDSLAKAENAEMFRHMAVGHAAPVREFMLELVVGPTTKQWLAVATPAIDTLRKGAAALDQGDLAAALEEFSRTLELASQIAGPKIAGAERDALLGEYGRLTQLLPLAFDLRGQRERREPLVVHHLLLQVPGLHKLAIDKLYAAGLGSLDALCRSTVADLVGLGRLDPSTAEAVFSRFQAYWRERTEEPLQRAEARAKGKLQALLDGLRRAHVEFQDAEANEDRDEKRRARNERRARCLEVNVLLAQLGEVDLVEHLERSSTELKIERVRQYIERPRGAGNQTMEETV